MKLGAVVITYVAFLIWIGTGRFYDIFFGIGILMVIFWLFSLAGRLIRSDRMVSNWKRRTNFLAKVEVIGFVAWLTVVLLNWIFN